VVHQGLDLGLDLVRQLIAIGAEQLNAVVLIGIVAGRNHHAEVGPQAARQHGDGRRRQRPDQHDIHAGTNEPGGHRRLDHVAGKPGVLADDDAVPVDATGEAQPGGLAQAQRHGGGHGIGVGLATNAVGAEKAALG
jgi:hypothetical protein